MESDSHEVRRIWGQANPCPECGGRGFLDRIDLVDRRTYEHCTECGARYSESENDLSLLYRD
jgi:uncharacterized protein (DUF983 family)